MGTGFWLGLALLAVLLTFVAALAYVIGYIRAVGDTLALEADLRRQRLVPHG